MGSNNTNGRGVERFQTTKTIRPSQPQGPPPAIPGYIKLGPDEAGVEEVLFLPICRRIKIAPPDSAGAELVTVTVEDGESITYGPAQSRVFLLATGLREEAPGLIVVPDIVRRPGLGQ